MIQPIKRKKVLRWLKKECLKLPSQTYSAYEKFHRPFFVDPEGNMYTEEMGKEGVQRRMVWQIIVECPKNHYRRCKKLYDKWGFPAVAAYFQIIGSMVAEKSN